MKLVNIFKSEKDIIFNNTNFAGVHLKYWNRSEFIARKRKKMVLNICAFGLIPSFLIKIFRNKIFG